MQTLNADVIWWDERTIKVRCPFCHFVHRHGFDGHYENVRRVSHCDEPTNRLRQSYSILFPFQVAGIPVGFEIDKRNQRFVAYGTDPEDSLEESLSAEFESRLTLDRAEQSSRPSFNDATEVDDEYGTLKVAVALADCVQGRLNKLKHFLGETNERHIFIDGENEYGKTALFTAAAERYPEMVEFLIQQGCKIDATDNNGRTPLMEAALWGRLQNVDILLQHKADKGSKDSAGEKAIDLATPSWKNKRERFDRSGGIHQVYKEDTYSRDKDREDIVRLLQDPSESNVLEVSPTPPNLDLHAFTKYPGKYSIKLFAPIESFEVDREARKTVAWMSRGHPFQSVAAKSGWIHNRNGITVSGHEWTAEVLRLSNSIGHVLPNTPQYDHGQRGRYYASHAEKQLIAYFVHKHVFLPEDVDQDLHRIKPSAHLSEATVLVSSPVCEDCETFVASINKLLKLSITVRYA